MSDDSLWRLAVLDAIESTEPVKALRAMHVHDRNCGFISAMPCEVFIHPAPRRLMKKKPHRSLAPVTEDGNRQVLRCCHAVPEKGFMEAINSVVLVRVPHTGEVRGLVDSKTGLLSEACAGFKFPDTDRMMLEFQGSRTLHIPSLKGFADAVRGVHLVSGCFPERDMAVRLNPGPVDITDLVAPVFVDPTVLLIALEALISSGLEKAELEWPLLASTRSVTIGDVTEPMSMVIGDGTGDRKCLAMFMPLRIRVGDDVICTTLDPANDYRRYPEHHSRSACDSLHQRADVVVIDNCVIL